MTSESLKDVLTYIYLEKWIGLKTDIKLKKKIEKWKLENLKVEKKNV